MRSTVRAAGSLVLLMGFVGLIRAGGDQKEQHQILDKAIKALGGDAKVAKLMAAGWKGTTNFEIDGQQITLKHEGSGLGFGRVRLDVDLQVNGQTQALLLVINGDKAWLSAGGRVNDLKGKELAPIRDAAYGMRLVHLLPALKAKDVKLAHLGELKVGDRATVGLSITRKGRPDVNLFFDKESGKPRKAAFRIKSADNQEKEMELLYDNYKDFDGLTHFTKMTLKFEGKDIITELTEITAPGELEATLFDRP
jgi:hypothetical protein